MASSHIVRRLLSTNNNTAHTELRLLAGWSSTGTAPCPPRELLIPLFDDLFDLAGVHVASQFGMDYSRMHGSSTYTAITMASVEGNSKENVRV